MVKQYYLVSLALFYKQISSDGLFLWMQQRQEKGSLNGCWEFPGGKIEEQETPHQAMVREVAEEVGINLPESLRAFPFSLFLYEYEQRSIALHPFLLSFEDIPEGMGKWFFIPFDGKSSCLKGLIPPINHQLIDACLDYIFFLKMANNEKLLLK